ncbi:quinone oxidoreductase family protein [Negadavirga shengliensis]|uniref:Zinc-binding alcohol dehydrogenase family protein n=1 Tax=Negadavirga shengliensis TaxID=1389218 RepID=A0ABV9T062_9BACT
MQQIKIKQYGNAQEAFAFEEQEKPVPIDSQLLIQVEGFGLNYADVMARNGLYKDAPKIPFVPGYEVVGKVIQCGKGTPPDFIGERVVAFTRFGGYAEQAVGDFRAARIIGDRISGGEACALATQYCTAYYMTDYISNLHEGETALIHACAGGVGTALSQLCRRKGVTVIGLCGSEEKVAFLEAMGVDFIINYKKNNYKKLIENRLGKRKIDYIFNTVAGNSFKEDMKLLNYGGKIYCFGGAARSGKKDHILNDLAFLLKTGFVSPLFMMMKSHGVIGVNMLRIADNHTAVIGKCLGELHQLWLQGEIKPVVGATFQASQIGEAHQLLESGKSMGKIYVYW